MRLLSVSILFFSAAFCSAETLQKASLKFPSGKTIRVDLALTPREQEIGLMFRTSLPKNYGMLFVFPSEQRLNFWMKNTWTNLDMIFISQDKKINAIYANVPRSYPETPESAVARRSADGQYVLELPAGESSKLALKKGDRLSFRSVGVDKK